MRRIAAWLAGLMMAASCAVLFPTAAAAPSPPALSVELRPAEQAVNASYEPQELTFHGRITLSNAPYSRYEVYLDACIEPGWSASCTPDYVTFWGEGSSDFSICVIVPQFAADKTARVWVESRATYEDVDVAGDISDSVYINVGKLPAATGGGGSAGGEPFFGGVSGGGRAPDPVVLVAAVCLPAALIVAAVLWRRRRRRREVLEVTEET
jgi:hypothetical protein